MVDYVRSNRSRLNSQPNDDSEADEDTGLEDVRIVGPDQSVDGRNSREYIIKLMEKVLSTQQCHALIYRFGLKDGRMMTLEQVGKKLNMTREGARKVIEKGLSTLKTSPELEEFSKLLGIFVKRPDD